MYFFVIFCYFLLFFVIFYKLLPNPTTATPIEIKSIPKTRQKLNTSAKNMRPSSIKITIFMEPNITPTDNSTCDKKHNQTTNSAI